MAFSNPSGRSPRIVVGGLFHETNTFLEARTGLSRFVQFDGMELLEQESKGHPVSAFLAASKRFQWEVVPAAYFRARPSGLVEDCVIEAFWDRLEESLSDSVDGVLLSLHGAMVSESFEDVEGEILQRVRARVGPDRPIFGVLDLHGNFTPQMARNANCLVGYQKNPHTDAFQSAERAAELLNDCLRGAPLPQTACYHSRRLYPAIATGTVDEPMKSLEQKARELESICPEFLAVNLFAGFAHSDTSEAGMAFSIVYSGEGESKTEAAFLELQLLAESAVPTGPVELPLSEAMDRLDEGAFPVVMVESADNIGGGGPGDGTAILEALLDRGVDGAVVVINDAEAVRQLWGEACGSKHRLSIGGKSGELGSKPLALEVEMLRCTDGCFELEDPKSHLASSVGNVIEMGPSVVVRCEGVTLLLTSKAMPPFDLGQLRSQGIEPENCKIIVVKAAVAYRQAYDKIARRHCYVDTDGPCTNKLERLPYKRLRRPIWPLD